MAKHIAYAFVQSHFGILSHDKWQETNGNYSYHDAYYHTIKAIWEPFDEVWTEELLEWWNKAVFGNKWGVLLFNISDDNEDDDNLILMRKQSAKCAAEALKDFSLSILQLFQLMNPIFIIPSMPATSLPPKEETTLPQQTSIPEPHPVKPAEKLACKTSSSTPTLASVIPLKADALVPVRDTVNKQKLEELEVDKLDSSLSEAESVIKSPVVVSKCGRKS
ncbi:hypothetical protein BDR04DRAFT_1151199 [Suillus decipiens]|nr:hypothetical protein BDR04DRAFT_1151199 [Suillus decipiens]